MTCRIGHVGIARFLGLVNKRDLVRDDFRVRPVVSVTAFGVVPENRLRLNVLPHRMHKPIVDENVTMTSAQVFLGVLVSISEC